jgi:MFS family permease
MLLCGRLELLLETLVNLIETDIPARMDRLPWSNWHTRVVIALGVTWLLDGLEGSLGGSLSGALKGDRSSGGLGLSDAELGLSSSFYLGGAVLGALLFGYLADRFGRRKLFFWTLLLYLCATAATGLSWSLLSFTCFRVLTGAGIGGEYAAINSAVDELTPARLRGRIDLWINGTFWLGIILGSVVSVLSLSSSIFDHVSGWRLAFCSGVPIGIFVLWMRRFIPESPRWLLSHGYLERAETVVQEVEAAVQREFRSLPRTTALVRIQTHSRSSMARMLGLLGGRYSRRALLCFALMAAQAFFYNSVFFSLSLVLMRYYSVSAEKVGYYFIPIAIANFLGPILLGRFFDTVGRRTMICATYSMSGIALIGSSVLFEQDLLGATSQVVWWAVAFFFASTAASSAYLTVSEVFPQEIRATAIAFFYAIGTLAGGVSGPLVFGHLIGSGLRTPLFAGYVVGATAMIAAGIAQGLWGVAAERRSLESVAEIG